MNPAFRYYGAPNPPSFTGTITSSLVTGDNITVTGGTVTAGSSSSMGTYPITPTFSDLNDRLPNYNVMPNGNLTVMPATIMVTATSYTRAYGAPLPNFMGTITATHGMVLPQDHATVTVPAPNVTGPGSYVLTPTFSTTPSSQEANYTPTYVTGLLTIVGPPPNIVAEAIIDGCFSLTWQVVPGGNYQVQSATSLSPANWANVGGVMTAPAMATTMSACEPLDDKAVQIYRVMLSEQVSQ